MALEGQQLGRYRLLDVIGRGGMGEVYLAEDSSLDRQVAIKVVRTELNSVLDTEGPRMALHLFRREARTIAMLDHPHILPLYDFGEQEIRGTLFTFQVMPYRPEGSLVNWLQRGREEHGALSLQDIEWIVQQAAGALQYAHDHQVVHQDVKPSNFLIRENKDAPDRPDLLLSDFGLARLGLLGSSASQSIRGTPIYMAPEQWEGRIHAATDQYALAVMVYELLTGRSPFMGTPMQMMYAHLNTPPRPPSQIAPQLSQSLDAVVMRALAKRPEGRFPSVLAFSFALRQALRGSKGSIPLRASSLSTAVPSLSMPHFDGSTPGDRYAAMPAGQSNRAGAALPASPARHERAGGMHPAPVASGTQRLAAASPASSLPLTPAAMDDHPAAFAPGTPMPSTEGAPSARALPRQTTSNQLPQTQSDAGRQAAPGSSPVTSISGRVSAVLSRNSQAMRAVIARRRALRRTVVLLIACALLLIACSYLLVHSFAGYIIGQGKDAGATATAQAQQNTSTLARAHASATALARQNATATAIAARANPYSQGKGTLQLNDPMRDNTAGHRWQELGNATSNSSCLFIKGAYHIAMKAGVSGSCLAQGTQYGDFTYQVQMEFVRTGQAFDSGGIVFRATATSFYYFEIFESGRYIFGFCLKTDCAHPLSEGLTQPIPSFHAGLNQLNTLAVVAIGNSFTLYVNGALVAGPVVDAASTSAQGAIGVWCAAKDATTEVAYSNAKVWA